MKNLEEFYENYIYEAGRGRPAGSKNKPKEWPNDAKAVHEDPEVKNAVPVTDVDVKKLKKNAQKKNSFWRINAPDPKWAENLAKFEVKAEAKNTRKVAKRFARKHDFLALGEAGWAKTTVIKKMASTYGYNVLTVYLDKAVATDLGGIPVPSEDEETGELYMNNSVPGWVLEMARHPKDKFLLFFDEMNQATPDVLNALMPIILEHEVCGIKFDNMFVGAAGNLMFENENGLSEINGPLLDRLKPVIKWDTHSDEAWNGAFKYLHATYDEKYGKSFIDKLESYKQYWKSPRDIERVIINYIIGDAERGNDDFDDPEDIMEDLEDCIWDQVDKESRTFKDDIEEIAEYLSDYLKGVNDDSDDGGRGADNVDEETKKGIIKALEEGYFYYSSTYDDGNGNSVGDNTVYVCTVENCVTKLFDPSETGVTAEVLNSILEEMEDAGKTPKYPTDASAKADVKKNGWEWPEFKKVNGKDVFTVQSSKIKWMPIPRRD